MDSRIINIWNDAREHIESILPVDTVKQRIERTKLRLWLPKTQTFSARRHRYHPEYRIPAYYDPNKECIFINEQLINDMPDDVVADICHHELLHATSDHSIHYNENETIFKSGLKLQSFSNKGQRCQFRGLNEGYVQFLSNKLTQNTTNKAYAGEVAVVTRLLSISDERVWQESFFNADIKLFDHEMQKLIGSEKLTTIDTKLDKTQYKQALSVLG